MEASGQEETDNNTSIPFFTKLIATGFFSGYIPWASGTFGTLVGILIYLLPGAEYFPVLITLTVAGFFAGVVTSGKVAAIIGHMKTTRSSAGKSTTASASPGTGPSRAIPTRRLRARHRSSISRRAKSMAANERG